MVEVGGEHGNGLAVGKAMVAVLVLMVEVGSGGDLVFAHGWLVGVRLHLNCACIWLVSSGAGVGVTTRLTRSMVVTVDGLHAFGLASRLVAWNVAACWRQELMSGSGWWQRESMFIINVDWSFQQRFLL